MNEAKDQEFVTSEFPLATTLVCMKINLLRLRVSKEDLSRIEFIFNKDQIIEKLIEGYWAGNLRVEPKMFWSQSRELKSRIKAQG